MEIEPFKIEEWMNVFSTGAKYDLTTTCIKPLSLEDLGADFSKDIASLPLTYGNIEGSLRLKNNIKNLYKNADVNNITVTHGAIGANQLVFLSLLEKGDEVVSVVPTYQQHYSIPKSLGAEVKLYFLKEENNWLPDIKELEKLITPKTKLLCLNNPNNPTGAVIPDEMLDEIVQITMKNDCWILSDEVYRGLNLKGNAYSESVFDIYDKGISVGSFSKTYSLPGIRVGWIAGRKDLIKEINHQRQYNTISVSMVDDYIASLALEKKEEIQKRNFKIMKTGVKILTNWIKNNPDINCVIPNGGTTALVRYNKDIPSRDLCKRIYEEKSLALLPGETLEMEGYVRIGYCAENLQTALNIFSDYIKLVTQLREPVS